MTVDRSEDNSGPATLSIFFAPSANTSSASATSSPAPTSSTSAGKATSDHTPFERVQSIDMKHRHEEEILEQVMHITKAIKVIPSPEEELELRQLEDQRDRSQRDAETTRLYNEKVRREKALLEQARSVVG